MIIETEPLQLLAFNLLCFNLLVINPHCLLRLQAQVNIEIQPIKYSGAAHFKKGSRYQTNIR